MMEASEILGWVGQLPKGSRIGIDDGGLCLRVLGQEDDHWLEVGGLPEEMAEPAPAPADHTHIGWPAAKDLIEHIQVEVDHYDENEDSYPVLGNVPAATLVALGLVKERLAPGPRATIIAAAKGVKIEVWPTLVKRWFYNFDTCTWMYSGETRFPITKAMMRELCRDLPEYDARLVAAALEADSI